MKTSRSLLSLLILCLAASPCDVSAEQSKVDLKGYVTLDKAVTTQIHASSTAPEGRTGHLGVSTKTDKAGHVVIEEVAADSPASEAGLLAGDVMKSIDGKPLKSADELRSALQSRSPGDTVNLEITRDGAKKTLSVTLRATSRPMQLGVQRAVIGVRMGTPSDRPGIDITAVLADKPAAQARLKMGDRIMKVDGEELGEEKSLNDVLLERKPGDTVKIIYRRANKLYAKDIVLGADDSETSLPAEERRMLTTWKKPEFKLAVICIEFSDTKHSEKIPLAEWEKAYFSKGTYNKTNATGQPVYGSMADYYNETSCGKLRISGRAFAWTAAKKKRMDYNLPSKSKSKGEFFNEIVDGLKQREGIDVLKDFDGLAFIYAGVKPAEVLRSSILWPHRASVKIGDKLWPYVIVPEASAMNGSGEVMANISTMCHEFGHILGLPDLYARPENPGSEGAGVWTVMSNQVRNGRPQHFCAWSKEQLGWLNPVVVDPTVKQKLILGPVEGSDHECLKVIVRPDGSEYFLLENRRKTGFDASLPAEGLLIWRVVANRPILEESHGVEGPAGPRVFLRSVPFPSKNNESFTPFTTPSSRSQMGGGLPVHISNIRQLPDERISLEIGYEFD